MLPPWPVMGMVVSQDPDTYSLNVLLSGGGMSGQGTTIPVKVLTQGPRDGVRGTYPELPTPGTHGLIMFPRGDYRNAHWIGATDPAQIDSNPNSPGVGSAHTAYHYAGGMTWRGMDGSTFEQWPDGSVHQAGPSAPSPTRHTLDAKQARARTPFPLAQRLARAVAAFVHTFTTPGGFSATVGASGGLTVVVPAGQFLTVTGDLHVTGVVIAGFGGADQVNLQTHTTTNVSTGAGTSGPPTPGS